MSHTYESYIYIYMMSHIYESYNMKINCYIKPQDLTLTFLAFITDLDDEPLQDNVHRIITHEFPRYFALVSRPKVEYGMVGPTGGLLTVKAVDREAIATFPEEALVKTIKVALQTLPIDPDLSYRVSGGKLKSGPVLTVEPRRRKFHKLINLTLPSPAVDESSTGLRLLYSLTEGNDKAEWEDLTDSVDFQVQ